MVSSLAEVRDLHALLAKGKTAGARVISSGGGLHRIARTALVPDADGLGLEIVVEGIVPHLAAPPRLLIPTER